MFGGSPRKLPQRFGWVLVPNYSLIAMVTALEPLRLANRAAGTDLYEWQLLTIDGKPVSSSNGLSQSPVRALDEAEDLDTVVVCGGVDVHHHEDKHLLAWLRRMDRMGADIGGLCTGGHVLASAGLLSGYRCTIHWENLDSFNEDFPDIEVSAQLFEIDGTRFTCAGGTAAADMMLQMIAMQHGHELAGEVAEQIIHERIREHGEHQRMSLPARIGVRHPKLLQIIERMQHNLEEPLSRSDLAREAGLSTRQLERLFRKYLSRSPARYYLELRLHKARLLLLQTNMSVMNAALACGFVSASHFTKCYRSYFGRTPYRERGLPTQSGAPKPEQAALLDADSLCD